MAKRGRQSICSFGFDGSNPSPSTIFLSNKVRLPRSQAVRHHTLTVAFASSNLAEAAIIICPVSSVGRAFDF